MKFIRLSPVIAALALILSVGVCAHAQTVKFIASFNSTNGNSPNGLIQATDGNFYGSAFTGNTINNAEIFRVTPSGEINRIFSFGGVQGYDPYLVVLGSDGNLYGINIYGGQSVGGIFYKLTLDGKFTPLHEFCGQSNCLDGKNPNGLFLGFDGNFYGTTAYGGEANQGVFFRISPTGKFKVLHSFCFPSGCKSGAFPLAPIQGRDGNFYGTTAQGGTFGGVIYKLTPDGTYKVIYDFCTQPDECVVGGVVQPLVQDAKGNLFGETSAGGRFGWGTIFEFTAEGQFKILHSFNQTVDGGNSNAGLILASDGNLYGVNLGGKNGDGTLFEITPDGVFTLLYTFDVIGNAPYLPLFQGTDGSLYGTIDPASGPGDGGVFQFSNNLGPLVETVPTGGQAGQSILILGNNLSGSTSVTFNGVPADFTVKSDTYIQATVPTGATTGTVSVVTPTGTLNSNPQFVVTK